jgi:hypothetical protein
VLLIAAFSLGMLIAARREAEVTPTREVTREVPAEPTPTPTEREHTPAPTDAHPDGQGEEQRREEQQRKEEEQHPASV